MLYVAFRPKKPVGKRKRGEPPEPTFNLEAYELVKTKLGEATSDNLPATPKDAVGESTFNIYKAAIWNLWDEQCGAGCNKFNWLDVWACNCRNLEKLVKFRRKHSAKAHFEEKMDTHFTSFKAHDKDKLIEEARWELARKQNSLRGVFDKIR